MIDYIKCLLFGHEWLSSSSAFIIRYECQRCGKTKTHHPFQSPDD